MNRNNYPWAIYTAKEILVALTGNPEVAAQGTIPDVREASRIACDAAEALVKEMEDRGWTAK